MSLLSLSAKLVASIYKKRINSWNDNAKGMQEETFRQLLKKGRKTSFGRDHFFSKINSYQSFKDNVPVRDYEAVRDYIGRARLGERDVLWPGRPVYFAMTSGTTSGGKYIPITKDSLPNHLHSTRLALLNYIDVTRKTGFLDGKYIFLSGSPELGDENGIYTGRLSGIVNHHVPGYLKRNQLPSWETNCIKDWQKKLDAIVEETIDKDMSLISGIPPWVEMYFELLLEHSEKSAILDIFPNFSLFIYGGVNFKPYEQKFRNLIGGEIDALELFPASEGFFAFQDKFPGEGLLLIPDSGIFYEFIPLDEFHEGSRERIPLADVKTDVQYVMILSSNAGMWAYNIGDTVKFTSIDPYRLVVTGRVSQYLSAFGEHVIAEEVEASMEAACSKTGVRINEFTIAPLVDNPDGKSCHEWFIEFTAAPHSLEEFREELDTQMRNRNHYYDDLVGGNIIQSLIIKVMPENSFSRYMKSIGKLGGQNKVPHLKNDRDLADVLVTYLKE